METDQTIEQQLRIEIDRLRAQFPETQDLYRETCILLFFRFGITPTANKLYQLVRKGSMSAPAEALSRFWADLREKSRVRIEHPDLPDELKTAAGELAAALWTLAQRQAHDSLSAYRQEAEANALAARTAQETAEARAAELAQALAGVREEVEAASARISDLTQGLAVERAQNEALAGQLETARRHGTSLEASLAEARRDFQSELEKLAHAQALSEERARAAEERALREIDHERMSAAKLAKELEQVRQGAIRDADARRAELAAIQGELGSARQQAGQLQGALDGEVRRSRHLEEQLASAQQSLAEAIASAASARGELQAVSQRLAETRAELADAERRGEALRVALSALEAKERESKPARRRPPPRP